MPTELRSIVIPIGPSIAYVPLTRDKFALIDAEDADWVGRYNWYAHLIAGNFYPQRKERVDGKSINIALKVQIVKPADGCKIDNVRGVTLDCRRSQLREASHRQLMQSRRLSESNRARHKGIRQRGNTFIARITVDGTRIHLGSRPTWDAAAELYNEAALKHFGEFARLA